MSDLNKNNNNISTEAQQPSDQGILPNSSIKWIDVISVNFGNFFSKVVEKNHIVDNFFRRNDQTELRCKIKNNYIREEMKELICFYNVFLIFLVLANLFLILRLLNKQRL